MDETSITTKIKKGRKERNMEDKRFEELVEAIKVYPDGENLMKMSPQDAANALNEGGHDFTEQEMLEAAETIKEAVRLTQTSDNELSDKELENVTGGWTTSQKLLLAQGLCTVGGWFLLTVAICSW